MKKIKVTISERKPCGRKTLGQLLDQIDVKEIHHFNEAFRDGLSDEPQGREADNDCIKQH
ncbi:hypothetical protein [Erwinia rhapontici]|uniref:hypothetical protein n=1 Tax=Erwinia rhapontici TaxID=55212 RepID=UPI003D365475